MAVLAAPLMKNTLQSVQVSLLIISASDTPTPTPTIQRTHTKERREPKFYSFQTQLILTHQSFFLSFFRIFISTTIPADTTETPKYVHSSLGIPMIYFLLSSSIQPLNM